MRPLEQYATLRRGREEIRQQEHEEWMHRAALLRKGYSQFARWLGIHLVTWGYKLQQVGTLTNTLPL
jgi:hypothetical protein